MGRVKPESQPYKITPYSRELMRRKLLEKGMGNPHTGRLKPGRVSAFFEEHGMTFAPAEVTQFWPVSENDRTRITRQSEKLPAMFKALGIPLYELWELADDEITLLRCLHVAKTQIGPDIGRALVSIAVRYVRGLLADLNDSVPPLEGQILPDEPLLIPLPPKRIRKRPNG